MPSSNNMQGKYWLLTIKYEDWNAPTELPSTIAYLKGQEEIGEGGYHHWQLLACFARKTRLAGVKAAFCQSAHCELAKSRAASDYVWKEDTAVAGTRFELGSLPRKRSSATDWDGIWEAAKSGNLMDIPADIRIRTYHTLKRIRQDFMERPEDLPDVCGKWYYGVPGAGKSFKARQDYPNSYLKPCNKWWDGYQQEENVLMDDLDKNHKVLGHHLKIWADRYSFIGESKGGSICIRPKNIIVTSNYSIDDIFGDDIALCAAIKRRFESLYFPDRFGEELLSQTNRDPSATQLFEDFETLNDLINFD